MPQSRVLLRRFPKRDELPASSAVLQQDLLEYHENPAAMTFSQSGQMIADSVVLMTLSQNEHFTECLSCMTTGIDCHLPLLRWSGLWNQTRAEQQKYNYSTQQLFSPFVLSTISCVQGLQWHRSSLGTYFHEWITRITILRVMLFRRAFRSLTKWACDRWNKQSFCTWSTAKHKNV